MLKRWSQEGGYREVLRIGLPLVVSFGSTSLIHFTDRVFLANYSLEAIAAALPAGIVSFLFTCFFMGVAGYVNVFIAQYMGAGKFDRVGASLWQGIYFSLGAAVFLALLYFIAEPLFSFSGHPPEVRAQELIYFKILTLGSGLIVISTALSCFFSGRGLTRPVMVTNLIAAGVNIPLDYMLINGVGPFPEMGIAGAAIATVTAQTVMTLLFVALIFGPKSHRAFGLLTARAFNRELFKRMMNYGLPGGIQFFVDIFAFTFFVFMVGRLGSVELAATNIVFAINTMAFLPMIGLSVTVSTMVGQALGGNQPPLADFSTGSALRITLVYMGCMVLLFLLAPEPLLRLFSDPETQPVNHQAIMQTGVVLLKFVAFYTMFDAFAIILSGALRGAGDIKFVTATMALSSLCVMLVPVYVMIEVLHWGLYPVWTCAAAYILALVVVFGLRYRGGKWKEMRVIEEEALPIAPDAELPQGPGPAPHI
jgi:MATE family multidrug resistance protein